MKSKNTVILLISFFFLLSCSKYDNYLYEVIEIKLGNADNSGEEAVLNNLDSLQMKSYSIQIEYTMKTFNTILFYL